MPSVEAIVSSLLKAYRDGGYNGGSDLRGAASDSAVADFELSTGNTLPKQFSDLYRLHNGQQRYHVDGLFGSHTFISIEESKEHYLMLKEIILDLEGRDPEDWVYVHGQHKYFSKKFIPFGNTNNDFLCVHSIDETIWNFCPSTGPTFIAHNLQGCIDLLLQALSSGEPTLFRDHAE